MDWLRLGDIMYHVLQFIPVGAIGPKLALFQVNVWRKQATGNHSMIQFNDAFKRHQGRAFID